MKWSELEENECPIARTLSVVGDRWTLLILRDCFLGRSRFSEFRASLGITRHVLSDRLAGLVAEGILDKTEYARGRFDYRLTDKGEALGPILRSMFDWGKAYRPLRRPVRSKG
ncbi:MAG: helix-turn-helix domain-containing protein [Pseudomonadota bacterium]